MAKPKRNQPFYDPLDKPKRLAYISGMDTKRRELMTRRNAALAAGDHAAFQALTAEIARLPLKGVPELTPKDIARYVAGKRRAS